MSRSRGPSPMKSVLTGVIATLMLLIGLGVWIAPKLGSTLSANVAEDAYRVATATRQAETRRSVGERYADSVEDFSREGEYTGTLDVDDVADAQFTLDLVEEVNDHNEVIVGEMTDLVRDISRYHETSDAVQGVGESASDAAADLTQMVIIFGAVALVAIFMLMRRGGGSQDQQG